MMGVFRVLGTIKSRVHIAAVLVEMAAKMATHSTTPTLRGEIESNPISSREIGETLCVLRV